MDILSKKDNRIKINNCNQLTNLLTLENLSKENIYSILNTANQFIVNERIKRRSLLKGKNVICLFFENSTRTKISFEIAAKYLSANVIHFDVQNSSFNKGETIFDTIANLIAMQVEIIIIRHNQSEILEKIVERMQNNVHIINAGDGNHQHPTQGLLDMYTIRHFKKDFTKITVSIIGDILHSRVARSDIHALLTLGCTQIRIIGPNNLLPKDLFHSSIQIFNNLHEGLKDTDVIIVLRTQKERMLSHQIPDDNEFFQNWGLKKEHLNLAKPDAIVMHPGPINRSVEISDEVADGPQSVILKQVTFGLAIRMAAMYIVSKQQ